LVFTPNGSSSDGEAANAYSATVLNGYEKEVRLAVPMKPGDYELRYRETKAAGAVFQRAPFPVRCAGN